MYKLLGIAIAAMPAVLFLRAILARQWKKRGQAVSEFKKQLDLLVWLILIFIGLAVSYSIVRLLFDFMAK